MTAPAQPSSPAPSDAPLRAASDSSGSAARAEGPDEGDLALIDDMLARSPEQRLYALEQTLLSLEALRAATGSTTATE